MKGEENKEERKGGRGKEGGREGGREGGKEARRNRLQGKNLSFPITLYYSFSSCS